MKDQIFIDIITIYAYCIYNNYRHLIILFKVYI